MSTDRLRFLLTATDHTREAIRSAQQNFVRLKGAVLGVTALFGINSFSNFTQNAMDAGDKIQKLAIKLGASTEALSEFKHVAELSGVSFQSMTTGLQRMVRRLSEASQGSGEAVKALQELGLSAEKLNQVSPEQQFEVLAEALSQVSNQGDRVRLAMKFFDSEGVALVQTMGSGAQGIREMREEAVKLGLSLSRDQADAMANANDAMARLRASNTNLANVMAIQLAPTIIRVSDFLREILPRAVLHSKIAFAGLAAGAIGSFNLILKSAVKVNDLLQYLPFFGEGFEKDAQDMRETINQNQAVQDEYFKEIQANLKKLQGEAKKTNIALKLPKVKLEDFQGNTRSTVDKTKEESESDKLITEAQRLYDQTKPPLEKYYDLVARVNELRLSGAFSEMGGDEAAAQVISDAWAKTEQQMQTSLDKNKTALDHWIDHARKSSEDFDTIWAQSLEQFTSGVGGAVADSILEQKSLTETLQTMARGVFRTVISGLVEMAAKKVMMAALERTQFIATSKVVQAENVATAASAAPGAALTTLATGGATIPLALAGIAATMALSKSFLGQAHDGLDYVPRTGTFLLEKGERVVKKEDNKKLQQALDSGGMGGGNLSVNFSIQALDTQSATQVILQNERAIVSMIQRAYNERGKAGPYG